MKALSLLHRFQVDFNTLTVVGHHNVAHAGEVYEFLRHSGSRYMQFIPLVERVSTEANPRLKLVTPDERKARLAPWSVPSKQYGEFLSQVFDIWIRRDIGQIAVQMFDVAIAAWTRQPAVLCVHAETCGHAFALEANGDCTIAITMSIRNIFLVISIMIVLMQSITVKPPWRLVWPKS